mmetsp:Transcript_7883/g.24693  ORF Transcript_7883/g.24693 Transcript_7883/m.24693 type:complete len:277 (-) Transcript_7883:3271-4101(-)
MYEMAPAAAAPARALAVPGEAHRAGPHLAQALDDVLVRQVVAARLRVAVLVNLAAEPRRDGHALEGLAEGPGLPRELLGHGAAVAAARRDDLGDDVVGHSICECVHELRPSRRVAVAQRHAGLLEGTIQIRRTKGRLVVVVIIVVLAHVRHRLHLDARRRYRHVLGHEIFLQDGRRVHKNGAALPLQQILGRGSYRSGRRYRRPARGTFNSNTPDPRVDVPPVRPVRRTHKLRSFLDQDIRADPSQTLPLQQIGSNRRGVRCRKVGKVDDIGHATL